MGECAGAALISFYQIGTKAVDNSVESVEKSPFQRGFAPATRYGLGIFAKEPLPGRVKTRLCPPLSADEAAALYRVSLEETVAFCTSGPWKTVLFYEGDRAFFAEAFPRLPLHPQCGHDLGERMAEALTSLLREFECAVLIGSDTPDLPLRILHDAFDALARHDAVVAPATDGGYVLVGERMHNPTLFQDIPWSTADVLQRTRESARHSAVSLAEITPWDDLDDGASLQRLIERSPCCRTAQFAREILPSNRRLNTAM